MLNTAITSPPRLAIDDSGHVHVTWFDFRLNYTNCYYDASVDGGSTFSQDLFVNDNRDSLSHALPRIAVGNGRVHVVYMDKRNGNNTYDIFFTAKGPLASAEVTRSLPKGLRLDQNYPNPFNPCTRIRFSVSSAGARPGMPAVTLRVYDILGKVTATLVDEVLPAGHYEVEFDGSSSRQHLSSGVYYYQLRAGGSVETKKMVYMK